MGKSAARVGVEVGGTFTDLVCIDDDRVSVVKVPSTPSAPEQGAISALNKLDADFDAIADLVHGSTVATNAVIERKGAHIAFLVTRGFRDLLLLQRNDRRHTFDLKYRKPTPLVGREDCYEIEERVLTDGSVHTPVDTEALIRELVPRLRAGAYEAVAVCLLNAYANPSHEQAIRAMLLTHLPSLKVTCSHDVSGEYREYERASTTAVSAYLQPVLSRYLERFEDHLRAQGFSGQFGVMQSNGGRAPVAAMTKNAVTALFSGPAAGVVGAARQLALSGYEHVITFDMGGTSTDVCLVQASQAAITPQTEIAGLPIQSPVIDIVSVGAGGGSVVRVDTGGMLRVGPQSAGASPGPACYGQGGTLPTITDAHVVRGTLPPGIELGEGLVLDRDAAVAVFEPIAQRLNTDVVALADSAIRLAVSNIVQAIQIISTERGHDPRDYVLCPFGGAGPMHAARVAEALGITTVVVPPNAGVLSAYGLVVSDWVRFATATHRFALDAQAPGVVDSVIHSLRQKLDTELSDLGVRGARTYAATLFMRFAGQRFELEVPMPGDGVAADQEMLRAAFADAYHRVFLHKPDPTRTVEIVSFRVGASVAQGGAVSLADHSSRGIDERLSIFEERGQRACRHVSRDSLVKLDSIGGPLIISDDTSTLYVPPGWHGVVDGNANLELRWQSQ